MTEGQERWARIDQVLTLWTWHAIQITDPAQTHFSLSNAWWARELGISERTIGRIRAGKRGVHRKPMGGARTRKVRRGDVATIQARRDD
jgi:hypothetical protein